MLRFGVVETSNGRVWVKQHTYDESTDKERDERAVVQQVTGIGVVKEYLEQEIGHGCVRQATYHGSPRRQRRCNIK